MKYVSDIYPAVLWSNPLLDLLFSYHCREEKRGGPDSVQTSAQHKPKITSLRSDPTTCKAQHTLAHKLAHPSTHVWTHFLLIFSTAHSFSHTQVTTHRKSPRDRGEEIRNTLPTSRVKTFATLERRDLSGEICSKRKIHPFVFKNLIPLQM